VYPAAGLKDQSGRPGMDGGGGGRDGSGKEEGGRRGGVEMRSN